MNFLEALTRGFKKKIKEPKKEEKEEEEEKDSPELSLPEREPSPSENEARSLDPAPKRNIKLPQYHFSEEEKDVIVRMIAQYYSPREIKAWIEARGKGVADIQTTVNHYKSAEKWRGKVEKYRMEFLTSVPEMALSNKAKRMRELSLAFDRVREREDRTQNFERQMNCIEKEVLILSKAQGEMEGKIPVEQTNLYITQFNSMSKEERAEYKMKLIDRIRTKQEGLIHAIGVTATEEIDA